MIDKQTLSWLTTVPASDNNFKNNLKQADKDTCIEALKDTGLTKTARKAIERRIRQIDRKKL